MLPTLVGFALILALAAFVASRPYRLATYWGAGWGAAFGLLIVAPRLLRVHHLHPTRLAEWLILDAALIAGAVIVGALVVFAVSWPLAFMRVVRSRPFYSITGVTAIWSFAWLPVAYLGATLLIQIGLFRNLPASPSEFEEIVPLAIVYGFGLVTLFAVYRRLSQLERRSAPTFVLLIALMTAVGAWVLPVRVPGAAVHASEVPPLVRVADAPSTRRAPLLVIGLDGADWRAIRPLVDSGRLPTFARMIAEGMHGDVEASWSPYWSEPAWSTIVTGHSAQDLGIHEDLTAHVRGLPAFELPLTPSLWLNPLFLVELTLIHNDVIETAPHSRDQLEVPPIWERLSGAGVRTAIVRFPFSYPASAQTAHVISNRAVVGLWDILHVRAGDRDKLVGPADADLLRFFEDPSPVADELLDSLLSDRGRAKPRDAVVNPERVLARVLDDSDRIFNATREILRRDSALDVVMLYVADLDTIGHAFWPYRFPEDYPRDPPDPADVTRLGPVMDRYLIRLDRQIGELLTLFPAAPNVLCVSDHGLDASSTATLWRAWHSPYGVFMAAGPDIPYLRGATRLSYFDVVPTMLRLEGFTVPADLTGLPVAER